MEKTCTGCGETKSLEEYHKQKVGKYGRCARCKVCKNAYQKTYQKKYDQSEKRKLYMKAYRQTEKNKAAQKKYRQSEAGKVRRKATRNNRRQTDPVYKLQCNLRSGFCDWIKGNKKTCRTEQYVGCTYKELLGKRKRVKVNISKEKFTKDQAGVDILKSKVRKSIYN